jgi:hypothetical protein
MKGLIIGTDLLEQNSSVKILEINTNVTIFNEGADYLDYDSFFAVLLSNDIQELHFIYNEIDAIARINTGEPFLFEERLKSKCSDNNIAYFQYKVPQNSITIPYIEDTATKFILRQAFDTTALIDESYCADKFEFFKLMESSEYIPKTYQQTSEDFNMDTLNSVSNYPGGEPNLIKKARRPAYDFNLYPAILKVENTSDLEELKNSTAGTDYLIQEFVYDSSNIVNDRWNIIRSIDIVYGGELDVLNIGSYRSSASVNINSWSDEYGSDGKTLTKKSRHKWLNKTARDLDFNYHADGDSLILGPDNQNINLLDIKKGDLAKSIDFKNENGVGPSDIENNEEFKALRERWMSTTQQVKDTVVTEDTELISINSREISGLFIKITLDDGTQWNDLPDTQFFIELAGSDVVQFDKLNSTVVGDKLLVYNRNTQEVSTKAITSLEVVYDDIVAYDLDFEPSDLFLVNTNNVEYAIQHNVDCSWCGWFGCGSYRCNLRCSYCGGGFIKS